MNTKAQSLTLVALLVLLTGCSTFASSQTYDRILETAETQPVNAKDTQPFDYQDYATVLSTYVDAQGNIDYAQLQENREILDRHNRAIGEVSAATYAAWPEADQIAFWLNAYNSLTLEAIINNYPVDSIRNIPGVWKGDTYTVLGEQITLDGIEHQVLRKEFNEPRIHMGLVCASIGCPILIQEPYEGTTLEKQLDDNTRLFLSYDRNFKINPDEETVYLSSIFKWFGDDFKPTYDTEAKFTGFNAKERSVLNFISGYLEDDRLTQLQQAKKANYLDYDWSLNRQ